MLRRDLRLIATMAERFTAAAAPGAVERLFNFEGAALPSVGIFQNPAGSASGTPRAAPPVL